MSSVGRLTWELCDLNQNVLGGGPITTHLPGAQVTIGREVARTATLLLDWDDDFAQLAQDEVGRQVLRCSVEGWTDPLFCGRVIQHDITYDGNTAALKLSAADPLAHLEACLLVGNVAVSPAAETWFGFFTPIDPSNFWAYVVGAVASNGTGLEMGISDAGAPDLPLTVAYGSTAADALRAVAGMDNMPEFEVAPVFANDGQLAALNTYHPRMGVDKTGTIILKLGEDEESEDQLLGFEVAPSMTGLVNQHVVIGDAPDGSTSTSSASGASKVYPRHPANRASHAGSISQYGIWETAESVSGASSSGILQRAAKAEVAANRNPITAFRVTLDPDTAPKFGPQGDFWVGDTIAVQVTTPKKNVIPYAGRVATASFTEIENGDVMVDLTAEPEDDAAGVTTSAISVVVDSTEGTDPPPPPPPEVDPCAPVAETYPQQFCPGAGEVIVPKSSAKKGEVLTSLPAAPKKKKKK